MRAALCSLPLSFRSQCFLAATDSWNVRLLCAPLCWRVGVWAPGPGLLLLAVQLRLGWARLDCTALHYTALHCNALADCCFCSTGREEEPLPGAPARHGRPFLCEALMATRWRVKREEEGSYILSLHSSIYLFWLLYYYLYVFSLTKFFFFKSFFLLKDFVPHLYQLQQLKLSQWRRMKVMVNLIFAGYIPCCVSRGVKYPDT